MAEEAVWKKALLHPSALIKDAIQVLSEASLRIVLIVDENLTLAQQNIELLRSIGQKRGSIQP